MRAVEAYVPLFLFAGGIVFACGGTQDTGNNDGGRDSTTDTSGGSGFSDVPFEGPQTGDAGMNCSIMVHTTMDLFDPVAYCALRLVLGDQHDFGLNPKLGMANSWNYSSDLPDPGEAGALVYDVRDTASYLSSCADFYHWSQLYGDSTGIGTKGGDARQDLLSLAPIVEKASLPLDYDGRFYFDLKNYSTALKTSMATSDAQKVDALAYAYGKQIFTSFFYSLPLSGSPGDGGPKTEAGTDGGAKPDATVSDASSGGVDAGGGGGDASGDPGATGDGILGIDQQPVTGKPGIVYQPDRVATGAYALLALANDNAGDPDAPKWIAAARQALDHIYRKGRDPSAGFYYASLVTTGGATDSLGTVVSPPDTLSSDVQTTVAFFLLQSWLLVTSNTETVDGGGGLDAGVSGVLAPMADFPFGARADSVINGLDPLWDGTKVDGGTGLGGYMDGIVPSTHGVLRTKSTRPNAYMYGALHLKAYLENDHSRVNIQAALRLVLTNWPEGAQIGSPPTNPTFATVVAEQQGYFETNTQSFGLLAAGPGVPPDPQSYTSPAAAAAFLGFNTELVGFSL